MPVVRAPNFARKTTPMPQDQGSLAQQLQRELARVGYYDGQINGAWTTSTRQAMKAFLERVNATLPISQPDGVLLALVQGQRVKTCGTPCPSGQDLTEDGPLRANRHPSARISEASRKEGNPRDLGLVRNYGGVQAAICTV